MKLKYYLRGLGIGILITTIIFMIGFHVNEDKIFSDEAVIARAKKLGMVEENGTKTLDELEAEQKKQQEQREEEQKKEEQNQEDAKEDNTEAKQKEDPAAGGDQAATVRQIQIDVLPGEYSRTICQKLFDAGLVADQEDFSKYITESDYDSLIQPGTFTIPEGSSYEEIAKILTTKQENR